MINATLPAGTPRPAGPFAPPPPPPPPAYGYAPPTSPYGYAGPAYPPATQRPGYLVRAAASRPGALEWAEDGLRTLFASPVLALVGAAAGALVARAAGKAMLSGGAVGAVIGGAALTAYYFGKEILKWAASVVRGQPPEFSLPRLIGGYGPAAAAVVAFPALGFLVGGPIGAIVGATVALPLGAFLVLLLLLRTA